METLETAIAVQSCRSLDLAHLEQETEAELFSGLPTLLNPQEREKEKQQRRKIKFSQRLGIILHWKIKPQQIYMCNYHEAILEIKYNFLLNKQTKKLL